MYLLTLNNVPTCSMSTEVENLIGALALNGVGSDPMDKEN